MLSEDESSVKIFKLSNFQIFKLEIMATNSKDFLASVTGLAVEDLKAKIAEDELRLRKLSFAHSVTPVENPMTIRALRKDIARLKTILRSKELGLA